ncbi:MAG: polyamine aminopropyltransferase [Defluviitaleaceae bacterium]|nr:polyamine aminopropyltransferase [Defluviitaleaceae bacterium]
MELWYTEEWTKNVRFSTKIKNHLYSKKSSFQQIDIFESYEFGRFLTLDGLMMVNEKDEFIYHDMIVHPAMCVNPYIKKVLVIGAGDGGTVRELVRYNGIEHIDMVEIDKEVTNACIKFLPLTSSSLKNNRVKLYFEDGLVFVKNINDNYYDLIIVDSTDPIGPGEGLFTKDFYIDCHRILNENGILINQHESPYFESFSKEMKRAHNKISNIFKFANIYQAHIPTYPSGHWLFGFASKNLNPLNIKKDIWDSFGIKTKYYNIDLHNGAFALPTYVKEMLYE